MTHAELVTIAERWARGAKRCPIVLSDVRCNVTNEQPDVIGWTNGGFSLLVECKASIADFQRDAKKWHRREPSTGMGCFRWYMAPLDVALEIARPMVTDDRWGVCTPATRGVRVLRGAQQFHDVNARQEMALLVNALRRATEGWGRRIFGEAAPPVVDGDPHPTASRIIRELRAENLRLRGVPADCAGDGGTKG